MMNLYISLKFSSALPVFIVFRAIKNSLAEILVIFYIWILLPKSPERDLAVEICVIDPPDAGGQAFHLNPRERLLEQRMEAG